jgi:hypothetical protein
LKFIHLTKNCDLDDILTKMLYPLVDQQTKDLLDYGNWDEVDFHKQKIFIVRRLHVIPKQENNLSEVQQVIPEQQKLHDTTDSKDVQNEQEIALQGIEKGIGDWIKWSSEHRAQLYEEAISLLEYYPEDQWAFMEFGVNQYQKRPKLLEFWIKIERERFSIEVSNARVYNLKKIIRDIDLYKTALMGLIENVAPEKKYNNEFDLECLKNCAERLIDQIEYESKQAPTLYNSELDAKFNVGTVDSLTFEELLSPAYQLTRDGKIQKFEQYYHCSDCDGSESESPGNCTFCNKPLLGDG